MPCSSVTSPPAGRWATPVDWAEESFSEPLGLTGLFRHDGLDGQISFGGGQMLSCRELAKVGQLTLNLGWWPVFTSREWPMSWVFGEDRTSFRELINEEYFHEMFRPSFPKVVSTYGFLTWLNRAPAPGDSECCMCTCGVCLGVPPPPILGVNENAWIASGYLSKYVIVLPQREAFIVSLGMDLVGSRACSASMSWAALTYDDTFGTFLHYRILNASLPVPMPTSTSNTTSATTSTSTSLTTSLTTSMTTSMTSSTTSAITTTLTAVYLARSKIVSGVAGARRLGNGVPDEIGTSPSAPSGGSTTAFTTAKFNPFDHIYNHGHEKNNESTNTSARRKTKNNAGMHEHVFRGGTCTCSCPIDEDFGRCFDLPASLEFGGRDSGQELCQHFAYNHQRLVSLARQLNDSVGGCPNVGLVQPCVTNTWWMGGGTDGLCGASFWSEPPFGLACEPRATCSMDAALPNTTAALQGPTGLMATCTCSVAHWKCEYAVEPCDDGDPYYPKVSSKLVHEMLKGQLPAAPGRGPSLALALCILLCVAALGCAVRLRRCSRGCPDVRSWMLWRPTLRRSEDEAYRSLAGAGS
mmetsp:Transcript_162463/g.520722  ORF Transcript_162463/g.520722 Transcript_162463/m.520722 type:complete len:581 (+) Transcript_162463:401-2143(+)